MKIKLYFQYTVFRSDFAWCKAW